MTWNKFKWMVKWRFWVLYFRCEGFVLKLIKIVKWIAKEYKLAVEAYRAKK